MIRNQNKQHELFFSVSASVKNCSKITPNQPITAAPFSNLVRRGEGGEGVWDSAGCTCFLCLLPVLSLEKLFEKWGCMSVSHMAPREW